jgi:DNA-directed RNA polymerase specialized sigma24 family protein
VLMYIRRRRSDQARTMPLKDGLCRANSHAHNPAESIALGRAIANLAEAKKRVVLLHDIGGFTHQEVAHRLGVTVSASKARLYRAHLVLRNMLANANTKQEVIPLNAGS